MEENAQEKSGNVFTAGKHRRKMLEAVRQGLAARFVHAMYRATHK